MYSSNAKEKNWAKQTSSVYWSFRNDSLEAEIKVLGLMIISIK